jgi:hypothetical protein
MWGIIGHVTVEAGNTVGTDGAPPQLHACTPTFTHYRKLCAAAAAAFKILSSFTSAIKSIKARQHSYSKETRGGGHEREISNAGRLKLDFAEIGQ